MYENRSWHTYSYALGFLCKNRCDTARALAYKEGASAGGGAAGPASSTVTKVRGPVAAPSWSVPGLMLWWQMDAGRGGSASRRRLDWLRCMVGGGAVRVTYIMFPKQGLNMKILQWLTLLRWLPLRILAYTIVVITKWNVLSLNLVYKLMRLKIEGLHAICLPCSFLNPWRVMLFKLICIYYNIA
jgi:hypothetical protein